MIINDDPDTAVADLEAVLAGEGDACSTRNDALRRTVGRIVAGTRKKDIQALMDTALAAATS